MWLLGDPLSLVYLLHLQIAFGRIGKMQGSLWKTSTPKVG